ncbi:MAG: hypothetical protein ACKVJG_07170 [Candidatus Latescibacterota bacterium]|jgi:long-chain fatty acid transport protein
MKRYLFSWAVISAFAVSLPTSFLATNGMNIEGYGPIALGMGGASLADAFYMPALGIVQRRGSLTYGVGVFGQGGMGTEFSTSSWLADPSQGNNTVLSKGLKNHSEVSVGRAIAPLTYNVNEKLIVGGSLDFVWAGIDLQMAMSESQFIDLATTQVAGSVGGGMVQAFGMLYEPFGGTGIS